MCIEFGRTRKDAVPTYLKALSCNGQERLRKTTANLRVTSVMANTRTGHHPKASHKFYYFR
jgi:hypothetical protein